MVHKDFVFVSCWWGEEVRECGLVRGEETGLVQQEAVSGKLDPFRSLQAWLWFGPHILLHASFDGIYPVPASDYVLQVVLISLLLLEYSLPLLDADAFPRATLSLPWWVNLLLSFLPALSHPFVPSGQAPCGGYKNHLLTLFSATQEYVELFFTLVFP